MSETQIIQKPPVWGYVGQVTELSPEQRHQGIDAVNRWAEREGYHVEGIYVEHETRLVQYQSMLFHIRMYAYKYDDVTPTVVFPVWPKKLHRLWPFHRSLAGLQVKVAVVC